MKIRIALILLLTFMLGVQARAQSARSALSAACEAVSADTGISVVCDLRAGSGDAISSLRVTPRGQAPQTVEAVVQPFDVQRRTVGFLFAIDVSDPRRSRTIGRIRRDLELLVRARRPNQLFGIATFSDKLRIIAPIGSDTGQLLAAVEEIKAVGLSTSLFLSARSAVRALNEVDVDRRALVIFSDGDAEDTIYQHQDVMKAAELRNVAVIGIGVPESLTKLARLQSLRVMAEDTHGLFIETDFNTKRIPDGAVGVITSFLDFGGTAAFELPLSAVGRGGSGGDRKIVLDLVASTQNDEQIRGFTVLRNIQVASDGGVRMVGDDDRGFIGALRGWFQETWASRQWIIVVIAAGILGVLAVVFLLITRRRGPRTSEPATPMDEARREDMVIDDGEDDADDDDRDLSTAPPLPGSATRHYATLEFLDADGDRIKITAQSTSIGRHSSNDIQLSNTSVHRQHALLLKKPDSDLFIIQDLSTELRGERANGVYVNEERISPASELTDGDLIELGEVRFRFYYN